MELIFAILVTAGFAWGGYTLAKKKNRNTVLWAILCGVFGIIPLIIIAVIKPAVDTQPFNDFKM